jgi:ABC-type proline/glycine betaine transport system permease subunit
MVPLHVALAWVAVAAGVVLLGVAVATAAGRTASYRELDAAILAQLATTGAAAIVGLVLPIAGSAVRDPLHIVYAVVALVVAPIARYLGRGDARRIGRFAVLAGLVVLGSTLRLFMTGR